MGKEIKINKAGDINKSSGRTPVTVIGLGLMGQALASALLNNNHPTTVWNRSPEKANNLVEMGAIRAKTISEAVAANSVVSSACLLMKS
ncbi:NAD(P)-binding domain-containing protein [Bacillus horti]|uniref:3-hydroxyisobutyrate dehydrogenase-like beta-hydroxyacid dehydrogenase n=1 Tax=Caldalkalibacillus horti TaxID=77523 RepID=A0ABT9VX66_9BACI|nr:NAD(P)-binding domain-containing protein [Bacillus horti]MDQ0165582.1 3-hydroxyisobutyrate dehydrogenase-like beta-hydroxyacid dehydrogenase [Bacillus horti]